MFKKSFTALAVLALAGCSSITSFIPAEPAYKLSDDDAKKWVAEVNKREKCVFPKQYKEKSLASLSPIEQQLYMNGVVNSSLIRIIGDENSRIMAQDIASKNYALKQYHKFKHSDPVSFDKKWCEQGKKEYAQALAQAKREAKKQEQEELAHKKKMEKEELARKKQAEKEEKARQAFYQTPQGQAYLAQQQMIAQQQQILKQQREYQERLASQQQSESFYDVFQQFNQAVRNTTNDMYNQANQINQMNYQNQINQMNQSLRGINNSLNQMVTPSNQIRWNNVY